MSLTMAGDVVVIVNNDVSETNLDKGSIKKMFLGKKTSWSSGDKIIPVTLKDGPIHKTFMKNYVKKSHSQFSAFWKQAIFTGKGTPPRSFGDEAELVKFVAETKGAIGYISSDTSTDEVKLIQIK